MLIYKQEMEKNLRYLNLEKEESFIQAEVPEAEDTDMIRMMLYRLLVVNQMAQMVVRQAYM